MARESVRRGVEDKLESERDEADKDDGIQVCLPPPLTGFGYRVCRAMSGVLNVILRSNTHNNNDNF